MPMDVDERVPNSTARNPCEPSRAREKARWVRSRSTNSWNPVKGRVELHELLTFLLTVLSPVAGLVDGGSMYLTPDVHTVVGTQWDVTRVVLTTPELDEGAVFVREGDRWRETMEETSTRFGSLRRLDDVRVRWSGGLLHVQCPKSAEVLLLVPDPEEFR